MNKINQFSPLQPLPRPAGEHFGVAAFHPLLHPPALPEVINI
ncbi:MAG TPA: hypothetical protein VFG54_07010 [Prolixibacteraceae bacterium]|nr:hypothetical protein [Prolixibacteraceae bacterium]